MHMYGTVRIIVLGVGCLLLASRSQAEQPRAVDDQLTIELFAQHPQIVTPTGLAVDDRGRVFVAESHTHFRPDDYDGPKADRILIFEDADGNGRANKRTVFHEGFVHVMDIDFHRDGSLYVATRRDIHRLRDTNNDNLADEIKLIVKLETKGDYPHNGLSGIAFDFRGGFHFGLGENLGEPYTLIGSDGTRISGGGEGGSTYHIDDDGRNLRRVTTGWWNPYGMCTDSFGRVFGTDNDPDSSPPCRLIEIVEDGDYGYEFRYGRSGLNPLVTWDGEIPGTLPMIAGTGEAPCHAVAYESDALPDEYFGNLLIPSWADHRVERYALTQRPDKGLVETKRQTLIDGPDDFRPVGIDVAPDGTVYVSDWVSSSYTLHKQGRIWRIRPKEQVKRPALTAAEERLLSRDRRTRERAAKELAMTDPGRKTLRQVAQSAKLAQSRATSIIALANAGEAEQVEHLVDAHSPLEVRVLAMALIPISDRWIVPVLPVPIRAAMLQRISSTPVVDILLKEQDPWLQHAGVGVLAREISRNERHLNLGKDPSPKLQLLNLLAEKRAAAISKPNIASLKWFLTSNDPTVRFMAVKWAADSSISEVRPQLSALLNTTDLDLRTFLALHVALDRLDGKQITDRPPPDKLIAKILDEKAPAVLRRLCLRLVDPNSSKLELRALVDLLKNQDEGLRLEVVRAIARHGNEKRFEILKSIAVDTQQPTTLRAEAIVGLAQKPDAFVDNLVQIASGTDIALRDEALRALVGASVTMPQRKVLQKLSSAGPSVAEAVARVVEQKSPERPAAQDTDGWLKLIAKSGDAAAGERIFFGSKIAKCASCHQVDGLGAAVGPDLSTMNRRVGVAGKEEGERWLLETTLQPSRDMAPQFTPWQVVTTDGKQLLGLPRRKGGNSEAYLGIDGREFSLKNDQIESRHEATVSIMPAELLQQLTRQELADLFAFLTASRS